MKISSAEATGIQQWLKTLGRKPGTYGYEPYHPVRSFDLDEVFEAFWRETTGSPQTIWSAVLERTNTGAWPKLKRQDAFWLVQRWEMADRICNWVRKQENDSAKTASPPPRGVLTTAKWLLLEEWDERLSHLWLRENARDYVILDAIRGTREMQVDLEIYLRKLEAREITIRPPRPPEFL